MQFPPSFELAYWVEHANAKEIEKYAGGALQNEVCEPNGWLFAGRIKKPASSLARLELGPVKSLARMRDFYGATVVVPTRNELDAAIKAVAEAFPRHRVIRRRRGTPESFVYDDLHVIATLGGRVAAFSPGLKDREFEVQVRTGLQFAWWRATHDVLYKGEPGTWRLQRVAGQTRATLELLDTTLANLKAAAELLDVAGTDVDADAERRAGWLSQWPDDRRPNDRVRFADAAAALIEAAGMTHDEVEALLTSSRGEELRDVETITPFQAVLALVVEDRGVAALDGLAGQTRVLVTDELTTVCEKTGDIPDNRQATPA